MTTPNTKEKLRSSVSTNTFVGFVLAAIIFILLFGCSKANAQIPTPSANTAGVEVTEKVDALTWSEKDFLLRMVEVGIPVPDKIIIETGPEGVNGWVNHMEGDVIHLTPLRRSDPNAINPEWPYVMGDRKVYPNGMVRAQTFVLAHELGHLLAPHLKAELGRPALGVVTKTTELQAEIIGMVLMNIAYGVTPEQMGFPKVIEYQADHVQDKRTTQLVWRYCKIFKSTWHLPNVQCSR